MNATEAAAERRWLASDWSKLKPGQQVRLTHSASGDVYHGEARRGNDWHTPDGPVATMLVYGRIDIADEVQGWDVVEVSA